MLKPLARTYKYLKGTCSLDFF